MLKSVLFMFFDVVSFVEFGEIFVAPLFLSESVFVLYINQPIEVDSIDQKNRMSFIECASHCSIFMHDLNWECWRIINLVLLTFDNQEAIISIFSSKLNIDYLVHVLD